ncbi:glycosyltransferase [Cetobacterium sp. 8H]|uniref:glycosyltransferase n=1 Tax=Cetobacterium sp. 8H TaxID=2759681 RepID=UPI00163B88DC|nr:glycosyltransferase [Cetobacterium sp. 8H]MBC2850935.1 glycosyltransferase [Cetobacterium sp. 8H]
MKNKIVIVYPSKIIDIRLYKFIKILSLNYEIFILSNGLLEKSNIFKDLDVKTFKNFDISSFLPGNLPFNIFRDIKISKEIDKINPDIVLVRDIFISTFKKNKTEKRKYYLDFCDHFPEVLEVLYGKKGKIFKKIANIIEKKALLEYDEKIFVSCEAIDFLKSKYSFEVKGTTIENVPLLENNLEEILEIRNKKDLVYLGTINKKIRNLEVVFEAIKKLKRENKKVTLSIYYFKHQIEIKKYYKELSKEMQIEDLIFFNEAVPKDMLLNILSEHKIGLVPHCRNSATDYTIPNKIYDYMQIGLPILCSDNPSLKNLIEKYGVGEVYKGNSNENCMQLINKMLEKNLSEYSENGKAAIKKSLNWKYQIVESGLFNIRK